MNILGRIKCMRVWRKDFEVGIDISEDILIPSTSCDLRPGIDMLAPTLLTVLRHVAINVREVLVGSR